MCGSNAEKGRFKSNLSQTIQIEPPFSDLNLTVVANPLFQSGKRRRCTTSDLLSHQLSTGFIMTKLTDEYTLQERVSLLRNGSSINMLFFVKTLVEVFEVRSARENRD